MGLRPTRASFPRSRPIVRRGGAWFYTEFARGPALYDVEQEARKEKRGLWALPLKDRIEPWEWRKRKRPRN